MEATHPTVERAPTAHARSWPRAFGLAALFLYVPQFLPFLATDLASHPHCIGVYTTFFPVLTGMPFGIHARIASNVGEPLEEYVLFAVAALVTLGLLGGAALALRRWRRGGILVAAAIALVSAALSLGAVAIIRS